MTGRRQLDSALPALARQLAVASIALGGCSGTPPAPPPPAAEAQTVAAATAAGDPTSVPFDKLPLLDGSSGGQVFAEPLARPTALGENTAVHMRLPPPRDASLTDSLVRVVGSNDQIQLLIRSDALAQLGVIPRSPGKDFFTSFATLTSDELAAVSKSESDLASGALGQTTKESIVFDGRNALGRTVNAALDPAQFKVGAPVAITGCPSTVVSTWAAWGKSLFITDPAVVMDPARTWDPCTGAGTQGGDWTFAHLIREMATGSSHTPEDFVQSWLAQWLNSYVVNGDIVAARTQMFNQVIQPWAAASGGVATLGTDPFTLQSTLTVSVPLDLDIAPFSLRAIVNRIDLGDTTAGGGSYNPSGTPKTPGEMRFIFGVVQPNPWGAGSELTCGRKPFTAIFEYGVPGDTCQQTVAWAKQWSSLQAFPGFTAAYRAQLDAMTESVVVHGAAPTKGNQNAINQIRTNEIALAWSGCGQTGNQWELREFTLTNESLPGDPAANGLLRKHSVARTPDDGTYSAGGPDPTINAFIPTQVVPPAATVANCNLVPNYNVPLSYPVAGQPFRGGNSLVPPPFWRATLMPATSHNVCARHQFSLNTCNGCHRGDTGTPFTHINPTAPAPVPLSNFLTGGGPGSTWNVPDPQFGAPVWQYADLQRRLQRLFDISHCTSCLGVIATKADVIQQLQSMGPVPADIDPSVPHTFQTGPITSLDGVSRVLSLRAQLPADVRSLPADFARAVVSTTH